jgi:hypothetical protein
LSKSVVRGMELGLAERTNLLDVVPPLGRLGEDGLDADLVALPAPSRTRTVWSMALMVTVLLLSLGLMIRFRGDFQYFWVASHAPRDLGRADRVSVGTLVDNQYVTLEAMPMASRAVKFRRLAREGIFRIYPVAGQPKIFIERFTPDGRGTAREEHGAYSGRMIHFSQAGGSYRSVRGYLEQQLGSPVGEDAWLLVDGEKPGDQYWTAALYAVLASFFLFNAAMLFAYSRPVRRRA